MGTTADKLNKVLQSKAAIKAAIEAKGVADVGDVLADYPSKIESIEAKSEEKNIGEWYPNPTWWDIESIIKDPQNAIEGYPQMTVILYTDCSPTTLIKSGSKYKTSDGKFYEDGGEITHTWDTSYDKQCIEHGKNTYKTRYIIAYQIAQSTNILYMDKGAIYVVSTMLRATWYTFGSGLMTLKSMKSLQETSLKPYRIFQNMQALRGFSDTIKMPKGDCRIEIVTGAPNLEFLDLSDIIFTDGAPSFINNRAITTILGLDISNQPDKSPNFSGCTSLVYLELKGANKSFSVSDCPLNKYSLLYILNNLQYVEETQTLTLGAGNLAQLSEEEKAIATNKGWTLA